MFCRHCGNEITDDINICPHCGCLVKEVKKKVNNNLATAAKVLMIIVIILNCLQALFCIIMGGLWFAVLMPNEPIEEGLGPAGTILAVIGIYSFFICVLLLAALAYMIPMYIYYRNKVAKNEPVGMAFKICTLIFFSRIAGILMLCDN